ncbi:MAG: sigma-70 family RNA polymerase sigma factor [Crocinitomicaceae bacterium]
MLFGLFSRKNIRQLSDPELLDLVRENNRFAFGELFQRYSTLVMGICLKYMKDVKKAEDVMMELFEQLPEKIQSSTISNFKSWLYSVSRNACFMELRKRKLNTTDFEKSALFIANESEQQLNEKLEKEEELIALDWAIEQLNEEQRLCIELFYLQKLSYDQICKKTTYPLKKVKSYIQNGKRNLKIILEKSSE